MNIKEIDNKISELQNALSVKTKNWDYSKSWEAYCKMREPETSQIKELDRQLRLIKPIILSPLPKYSDIMTLDNFIKNVKCGGFIDYDGYGLYIKDDQLTNIDIYPSDVKANSIRTEFTKIIWYNK
jgi:hypothetical protein